MEHIKQQDERISTLYRTNSENKARKKVVEEKLLAEIKCKETVINEVKQIEAELRQTKTEIIHFETKME